MLASLTRHHDVIAAPFLMTGQGVSALFSSVFVVVSVCGLELVLGEPIFN